MYHITLRIIIRIGALVACLVFVCIPTVTSAANSKSPSFGHDTILAYSAQSYHYDESHDLVYAAARHHVFVAEWPNLKIRQISFGTDTEDICPSISPNRKWLAYLRQRTTGKWSGGPTSLVIANVRDGKVFRVINIGITLLPNCTWSPDGRWVAVSNDNGDNPNVGNGDAYLIAMDGRHKTFGDVDAAVWSPDGRHLFLASYASSDRIVDVATLHSKELGLATEYGYWIDNKDLVCGPSGIWSEMLSDVCLVFVGGYGRTIYDFPAKTGDYATGFLDPEDRFDRFSISPMSVPAGDFLLTFYHHMTDGDHSICYMARGRKSSMAFLGQISFATPSPNNKLFAGVTDQWVGAYKRGGARLGNLYVFSLHGSIISAITHGIYDFDGVDWK